MSREAIQLTDSVPQVLIKMSEGNPGAFNVLSQLVASSSDGKGLVMILSLDDMNIRGSQIWIGYNDYCKGDIQLFIKAIEDRDPEMVYMINDRMDLSTPFQSAVPRGASFRRRP